MKFSGTTTGVCAAAGLSLLSIACANGAEPATDPELETQAQAIIPGRWRPWSPTIANSAVNTDPAICSNQKGFFVTVRGADQTYYVRRTFYSANPAWKQFGTLQFNSAPTCTMQYPTPNTDPKFLLAGKSTDNRMYVVEGVLPNPTDIVAPNPDWTGPWSQVSPTQYSGTTNGRPALSSNGNKVVLAFMNNNQLFAHHKTLPYSASSWSLIGAPALPAGATVTGIPGITYVAGTTNKFTVMVRAVNSGSAALLWIYFNGSSFDGNWTQAFIPYNVDSDPALEYDNVWNALTVYFKSGNEIIQTTVETPGELGVRPFYAIPNDPSTNILGAPRVVFGGGIEGIRAVAVRGYNGSVPTAQRSSSVLLTEITGGIPSPWEE